MAGRPTHLIIPISCNFLKLDTLTCSARNRYEIMMMMKMMLVMMTITIEHAKNKFYNNAYTKNLQNIQRYGIHPSLHHVLHHVPRTTLQHAA